MSAAAEGKSPGELIREASERYPVQPHATDNAYTPSMDEIRDDYGMYGENILERDAEFDRALAAHEQSIRTQIAADIRADAENTSTGGELWEGMIRAAALAERGQG